MKDDYAYQLERYFVQNRIYVPIEPNSYAPSSLYGRPAMTSHENKLVDHILGTIHENEARKSTFGGDIDDLFQNRIGLIRSKIELLLLQIDQRKEINQENLYGIDLDSCRVQNLIFQMGYRTYRMDRDRLSLEKMKFDLEAQRRIEETSYFRDTGLLNKDLKDALIEYLGEVKKSAFFSDGGKDNDWISGHEKA